ncbi:MAG TPA: M1 family aminopeptidase [Thermoanaerobaculia bacterium]|nr:M1 family aminopeptidase [Thermoanaerobaculia bacterium]
MLTRRLAPALAVLGWLAALPVAAAGPDPKALLADLDKLALRPEAAVVVPRTKLAAGLATLTLEGKLIPAAPVGGHVTEMIFLGNGRIELTPPDEIEAGQLDLFTGDRQLDERFDQAVLVIGPDGAVDTLLKRPHATLDPAEAQRATAAFEAWRKAPERDLLNVRGGLWADALGEPVYQGMFVGRFHGVALGDFLYSFDPQADEQVTLGRFVPIEATEKEKRKILRRLEREQKHGRLLGIELDDLGQWDTWLSASLRGKDGKPTPGAEAFEPVRYTLDVVIDDEIEKLHGNARIELRPVLQEVRTVVLHLPRLFEVKGVRSAAGESLPYQRSAGDITVVLAEAPPAGGTVTLAIEYEGVGIASEAGSYALLDTQNWYPHAGQLDRARYDATFHWPRRYDLLAPGRQVEAGEKDGRRFVHRTLDRETWGYTFEIGKFKLEERQAGHVKVALAFDPLGRDLTREGRAEIGDTIVQALAFFEESFGPYPLDDLTVVTIPRSYSQSMLGFVTLSDVMMLDTSFLTFLLGLEDRRTIIAHELAHQWWGHQVGWQSYRDVWLSEAMANYSALLYQRKKLDPAAEAAAKDKNSDKTAHKVGRGPTAGWQGALTAELPDGRAIESVGPLVLGWRLVSSRSSEAYQPIVYQKGAVVLDMLARGLGQDNFPRICKEIVRVVGGRPLTTRDFFDLISRISGSQLEPFVRRFVEGTGLPELYYHYKLVPDGGGKWQVEGEARLETPYHFRYRAVASGGVLDVARDRLNEIETVDDLSLVVPVQASFYDPARDEKKAKRWKKSERPEPNALLKGHFILRGAATPFSIPVDFEPQRFWLDRDAEVFGRFFDESRDPKRTLYYHGLDEASAGKLDSAADLFSRALAAEVYGGDELDRPDRSDLAQEKRILDGRIQLAQARLSLDRGRDAEAQAAFDKARKALRSEWSGWSAEELRVVGARLDVRRGDFERAFKDLRKALLKRADIDSTEGYVLLAIAAQKTGHAEELKKARDAAKEANADLSALGTGG